MTRHVDMHRAEAGDAAHERADGGLHQSADDRRIGRVAAVAQDVGAGLDRLGLGLGGGQVARLGHGRYPSSGSPISQ